MAADIVHTLLVLLLLNGAQSLDNGEEPYPCYCNIYLLRMAILGLALTPPMGWNTWCTLG